MSLFEAWLLFGHVLLFVLLGHVYLCGAGFPFGHVSLFEAMSLFPLSRNHYLLMFEDV